MSVCDVTNHRINATLFNSNQAVESFKYKGLNQVLNRKIRLNQEFSKRMEKDRRALILNCDM
jgi:hypothetical protein